MSHRHSSALRILVLGYLVRGPLGGLAWHHIQYILGLVRLGHDVWFIEDSEDYPACYNPRTFETGTDPSYGLAFAERAFQSVGLGDRWAYYDAHAGHWRGPASPHVLETIGSAHLLLNVSAVNPLRSWLTDVPVRAYIDTDPAFTQVRHLTDSAARLLADQHTQHFTFGENIARGLADLPSDGFNWKPTRQPVVLDVWPVTPPRREGRFTTIMQWDSYRPRQYNGVRYGMKAESFGPYLRLPAHTSEGFELVLGSATAPRDILLGAGWRVVDPQAPTRDPWAYQRYIQSSKAEFSVAKHGYVISASGWFSERSANYLASGRPVVTQETGFSKWLATGEGVLAYKTPSEAAGAIEGVSAQYEMHCAAAREIANEYFDSTRVLEKLIEDAMQ